MQPNVPAIKTTSAPGLGILLRLKLSLLRNRITQMIDQSPLRLLLAILFVGVIWAALYEIFDQAFTFMRRFEQSAIAIPYVFHVFFVAMTFLLAFSMAALVYGALFGRAESSFLLATPSRPRDIVTMLYVESLFYSSWSLLLLGVPMMLAVGRAPELPWHFYVTFVIGFLGFVPIPGTLGLLAALAIALWLPRLARRALYCTVGGVIALAVLWWGRLWALSEGDATGRLEGFMTEFQYLKAALLPSTWVSHAIQKAIEDKPADAAFYLIVTVSTALFLSWAAINITGQKLLVAFGRAHTAPNRSRVTSGWASRWLTHIAFAYLPRKMRTLILKDVRNFLRDPVQWSQLAILFGLLGLYLAYLPRARPGGFNVPWRALICFLNFGAISLILSTFTSRFVFPMISLEGRTMWLVGLWPLSRARVMWAKFLFALTVTGLAAGLVTILSIWALDLPLPLGLLQALGTLATCVGLCGLAVGMGARLACYRESDSGRIAAGLGGTVNLIASVGLVTANVGLFGGICYHLAGGGRLDTLDGTCAALFFAVVLVGVGSATTFMHMGIRSFRNQDF